MIEEETKRLIKNDGSSEGYIFAVQTDLISLILEGISKINEDEEEDDWGVCQKACECLQSLSLILKNDIIGQVGVFFKNQIE